MTSNRIPKRLGWGVMTFLSCIFVLVASPYLSRNPAVYLEEQLDTYLKYEVPLLVHIAGAMVALLLGPFQFVPRLRRRGRRFHRWSGRVYIAGVGIGGLGGFFMAFFAYTGAVARIEFLILSILWLLTAWFGLSTARRGLFDEHRRWMIRNFALTFAAVTLRLELGVFIGAGLTFEQAYPITAWSCWVCNLIVVEAFLRRSGMAPLVNRLTGSSRRAGTL